LTNIIIELFPTADRLLEATEVEVERVLLRLVIDVAKDQMRRWVTRDGIVIELFGRGGYAYDHGKKLAIEKAVSRAWKTLEKADLIEEPDPDNGKNGYRVATNSGRAAIAVVDFEAAKVRSMFARSMFHPALPDAAWNAFRVGDYDTAVFEAFKSVEVAVRKKSKFAEADHGNMLMTKAFNPENGPLTDMAAPQSRREARRDLFKGALGELRNPKGHNDPTITDTLIAVEEMMTAGALLRIVDSARCPR
jgi:uncharacterized protein (TIGR02391 family)